jgi:hypothetical protein
MKTSLVGRFVALALGASQIASCSTGTARQAPDSASAPASYVRLSSRAIAEWSLTTLRDKMIKIGVAVVSHGRYFAFQISRARKRDGAR